MEYQNLFLSSSNEAAQFDDPSEQKEPRMRAF